MRKLILTFASIVFAIAACTAQDDCGALIGCRVETVSVNGAQPNNAQVGVELDAWERCGEFSRKQPPRCDGFRVSWLKAGQEILTEDVALAPPVFFSINTRNHPQCTFAVRRPLDAGDYVLRVSAFVSNPPDKSQEYYRDRQPSEVPVFFHRNPFALFRLTAAVLGLAAVLCGALALLLRGRFRLHLSTCVAELLATGVLLGLSAHETFCNVATINGGIMQVFITSSLGWPLPLLSMSSIGNFDWQALALDALVFVGILAVVAVLMEWLFKRRPARIAAPVAQAIAS